jgi:hypothetical protein
MDSAVSSSASMSSEVTERAQRRRFGGEYKARTAEEYDALRRSERARC